MQSCPDCHGTGVILLFTSASPCETCGGTGQAQIKEPSFAETLSQGNTAASRDIVLNGISGSGAGGLASGSGGTGGNFIITGGTGSTSGAGGSITITSSPYQGSWYADSPRGHITTATNTTNSSAFSFASGGGPTVTLFTGSADPTSDGIYAEPGSLYFYTDGESGSLWLKTGKDKDSWAELSTANNTTADTEAVPEAEVEEALRAIADRPDRLGPLEWTIQKIKAFEEAKWAWKQEQGSGERYFCWEDENVHPCWVPCIAPVHTAILADMMAMLEQDGYEIDAFVASARDFADVRKMEGEHVRWNGKEVTLFGIPFLRSSEIPPGYVAAVSTHNKIVFGTITR